MEFIAIKTDDIWIDGVGNLFRICEFRQDFIISNGVSNRNSFTLSLKLHDIMDYCNMANTNGYIADFHFPPHIQLETNYITEIWNF